jgi:hypothetical protein
VRDVAIWLGRLADCYGGSRHLPHEAIGVALRGWLASRNMREDADAAIDQIACDLAIDDDEDTIRQRISRAYRGDHADHH